MLYALVRPPSPGLADGLRTFVERHPISFERALAQHRAYCEALRRAGAEVVELPPHPSPDACFVEDTAVVLDELAVLCPMGAEERSEEAESVARALARFRPLRRIEAPAKLEGGDVLRHGRTLYVGRTRRTNEEGVEALREIASPLGYRVEAVPVRGALHLKTAATSPAPGHVLLNPSWIDGQSFPDLEVIETVPGEPFGANTLPLPGRALVSAACPSTRERLEGLVELRSLDISELEKAEAGLTCLSLIFDAEPRS